MCVVLVVATMFVAAPTARAEPEHASVLGGIALDTEPYLNAALTLDGSVRFGWLAVRAIVSRGAAVNGADKDMGGSGPFRRYSAGVEARLCSASATTVASDGGCVYLGLDGGYQTVHVVYVDGSPSEDSRGAVVGARIGGYRVYHRLAARVGAVFMLHDEHSFAGNGWQPGMGIELGLGYRF
jgi:hypothetical protein